MIRRPCPGINESSDVPTYQVSVIEIVSIGCFVYRYRIWNWLLVRHPTSWIEKNTKVRWGDAANRRLRQYLALFSKALSRCRLSSEFMLSLSRQIKPTIAKNIVLSHPLTPYWCKRNIEQTRPAMLSRSLQSWVPVTHSVELIVDVFVILK